MRKYVDGLVNFENQYDFWWRKKFGLKIFWTIVVE